MSIIKRYPVSVSPTSRASTWRFWLSLYRLGLRRRGKGVWGGMIPSGRKMEKIRAFCDQKHLHFKIEGAYGTRTANYRQIFFTCKSPAFFGLYFCAYCGRLLSPKHLTVDHLYPIGQASRSLEFQKDLKRKGLRSIDDPANLVAACNRCNRKKSDRTGRWIMKGRLGRHALYWYLRWALRFLLAALLIWVCRRAGLWEMLWSLLPESFRLFREAALHFPGS